MEIGDCPGVIPRNTQKANPKANPTSSQRKAAELGIGKRMEVSALNPKGFQELWECRSSGSGVCQRTVRCATFARGA